MKNHAPKPPPSTFDWKAAPATVASRSKAGAEKTRAQVAVARRVIAARGDIKKSTVPTTMTIKRG